MEPIARGESIFWIEVDKIKPNPFQPRHEFNEDRLRDLADSIRQYGVLQPLVVTRKDVEREDGGLSVEYELIAGERRLRASKIAGISQVPAIIKSGEQTDKMKLELAIIENLQREDLNPLDRAQAFHQLVNEFGLKHTEVAKRVGRSREYVSNSLRMLALPQIALDALMAGQITEGHTRPILMLIDRPEEQIALFHEIVTKRLNVRESEQIARRIAYDKVRKKDTFIPPEIIELEEQLTEKFGTRVKVDRKDKGGRVTIDFFSDVDLRHILDLMAQSGESAPSPTKTVVSEEMPSETESSPIETKSDDDLYSVRHFSL